MLNSLDFWARIAIVIIGISNLILGFFVFRFNYRKDNFSKLSLKPVKIESVNNLPIEKRKNILLEEFSYVNDMNDENFYYLEGKNKKTYRFGKNNGYCAESLFHENYDWVIKVENKGLFPSTNIYIKYEVIVKKLIVFYNEDTSAIDYELIIDDVIENSINIDYIAADATKNIFICNLKGEFPNADLNILELKSSEMRYIKKSTQIDNYVHPNLMNSANVNFDLLTNIAGMSLSEIKKLFHGVSLKTEVNFSTKKKKEMLGNTSISKKRDDLVKPWKH